MARLAKQKMHALHAGFFRPIHFVTCHKTWWLLSGRRTAGIGPSCVFFLSSFFLQNVLSVCIIASNTCPKIMSYITVCLDKRRQTQHLRTQQVCTIAGAGVHAQAHVQARSPTHACTHTHKHKHKHKHEQKQKQKH